MSKPHNQLLGHILIGRMKKSQLIILIAILISLSACENYADINNHKKQLIGEFSFSLPANWEVIQEVAESGFRYLYVESPGLAIVQVAVYDQDASYTLREYAKYSIEHTEEGVFGRRNEGTLQKIIKSFRGKKYSGYRNEYVWTIVVFRSLYHTEFFKLQSKDKDVFITTMAPVENLGKVGKGFELIISSFGKE